MDLFFDQKPDAGQSGEDANALAFSRLQQERYRAANDLFTARRGPGTPRRRPAGEVKPPRDAHQLRARLYLLLFVLDGAAMVGGFLLAHLWSAQDWMWRDSVRLALVATPLYLLFAIYHEGYALPSLRSGQRSVQSALAGLALASFALLSIIYFLLPVGEVSRRALGLGLAFGGTMVIAGRLLLVRLLARAGAPPLVTDLVIVDDVPWPDEAERAVIHARDHAIAPDTGNPYMMHRIATILRPFDRVIIRCSAERQADWALVLKGANIQGEIMVPGFNALGAIGIEHYRGRATLLVSRSPLRLLDRAKKRAMDIAITVPILIALMIPMIIVAIAIKLDSRGPVLFKQDRIGRGNQIFKILKFRSMRVERSDQHGAASATRDDDRITRVGRFIRKTSIDELPQLINVLLGDMSLVGPRPHALGSRAGDLLFWDVDRAYWHRHALKPGITGLAQVRGHRGATHRDVDLRNRLQSDLEYLHRWSLTADISILFQTLKVVVHRNAY